MTTTKPEPRYKLNVNDAVDTLHRWDTLEACNWDDSEGRTEVDEMTAEAMILRGDAVSCQHCKPLQELPG
jgi:hypothetical protein